MASGLARAFQRVGQLLDDGFRFQPRGARARNGKIAPHKHLLRSRHLNSLLPDQTLTSDRGLPRLYLKTLACTTFQNFQTIWRGGQSTVGSGCECCIRQAMSQLGLVQAAVELCPLNEQQDPQPGPAVTAGRGNTAAGQEEADGAGASPMQAGPGHACSGVVQSQVLQAECHRSCLEPDVCKVHKLIDTGKHYAKAV